ncbi:MAG TPA: HYR domain-containing protein, partial [candidate division Zixibacteria bacterium]|nr:HYR domain-containing protein [candidate division Zixibacteria bacterium]
MKVLVVAAAVIASLAGRALADIAMRIERSELARPGDRVTLTLAAVDSTGAFQMGGFEMTVRYDTTLTLIAVNRGQMLNLCGWEYFTSNLIGVNNIHITAIADISNGAHHPSCFGMPTADLVDITFDIPWDYSLYGRFLPVKYIWYDCGDNAVSSRWGDTLYMSDDVYGFDGISEWEITRDTAFPTPYGAPSWCSSVAGGRILDFYSGGVSLIQQDFQPPVAHCPNDTTVAAGPSECAAVVEFTATVTDNRPGATISCTPPSGTYFYRGANYVQCIAVDAWGNRDTCGFTVTVTDTSAPILAALRDTVIGNAPNECGTVWTYSAATYDNCPGVTWSGSPPPGSYFSVGATDVIVTAVDYSGNRKVDTFWVTVEDRQWPVAHHPDSVMVAAAPGQCSAPATFSVTATDNCPLATAVAYPPSGSVFPVGTTMVQVIATDLLNNCDTTWFPVTVRDTEPPQLIYPESLVVGVDSGQCAAAVTYTLSAVDNCGTPAVTVSLPPGSLFPLGTTAVTAAAADLSGNVDSAAFYITVVDDEPPRLTAPHDLMVPAEPGVCSAMVAYAVTAADNCGSAALSVNPPSGSYFPVGVSTVEAVAVDAAGNVDTARFTVTVRDEEPPAVTAPADLDLPNDSGACGAAAAYEAAASDNCGLPAVTLQPSAGSFFLVGATAVRAVAVDAAGNADTAFFTVTVHDTEPPTVQCPEAVEVTSDSGLYGAVVHFAIAALDNCAGALAAAEPPSGSLFPL